MEGRKIAFLAFTQRGAALGEQLRARLGGRLDCAHGDGDFSLFQWTETMFAQQQALVFVGAVGIAVRAVAPFLRSKASDPAVVALDEGGRFVIPLVSGHLGGANELAREIAALCGGTPVITTATDVNGVFAMDLWAKRQNLAVVQPRRIKDIPAKLLAGEPVWVSSRWPVAGEPPAGVRLTDGDGEVCVDVRPGIGLCLAPRALVLGIGCRRGTSADVIGRTFARFCALRDVLPEAVCAAASIDRKAEEPGLLGFCRAHGWPVTFYTAQELDQVPGDFTASEFVAVTVGVDNVCERSAVLAAQGPLLEKKYAEDGVTLALALRTPQLDWSW